MDIVEEMLRRIYSKEDLFFYSYMIISGTRVSATEALRSALKELTPSERRVIALRLLNKNPKTFKEISRVMGVSRSRPRQILSRGLRKLRRSLLINFIIPSPEELTRLKDEVNELKSAVASLQELKARKPISFRNSNLRDEDRERFEAFFVSISVFSTSDRRFKKLIHNALLKANLIKLSDIRQAVISGDIKKIKGFGPKAEEFIQKALDSFDQKAPP